MSKPLSFAQSYILASKVRNKLTREAANPKSSLHNLVVQANMLDNLMDHISVETEKRTNAKQQEYNQKKVSFDLNNVKPSSPLSHTGGASITEYEVDSDSDEEFDSDSDSDSEAEYFYEDGEEESDEESDSDYYYSDDEDYDMSDVNIESKYKKLPVINLSSSNLSIIQEENESEDEGPNYTYHSSNVDHLPELTKSISLTDSESDNDEEQDISSHNDIPDYHHVHKAIDSSFYISHNSPIDNANEIHHQRNGAIYSMDHVFWW